MAKELMALFSLALATPAMAQLSDQVDLKKPEGPVPAANEAMIVLRPHALGMVGDNRILFYRYDPATRKVALDAQGKPVGTKITYSYTVFGGKKGEKALRVAIVPAGDYVLAGRTFNMTYTDVFCLGAPHFRVEPGSVTYIGDFEMLALEKMADGGRRNAMRYSADLEGTRQQFAAAYPQLSAQLEGWQPANGATFQCLGDEFVAYRVPTSTKP
ncbi:MULTISPECIES: hypothetical protein [Pseudomonadota]|jgi:hypothetical protein|uniref:hypothetical protein n=1 Tax=Pseudomonadota TaxID=1224 RepID=UPI000A8EF458|nr:MULTISPECIES: hypothetical protein [Pseudomonadota]|tara:strand:- start:135241 stop:135882 length:642 start_codon:yes stop_codon:yes gene_type:complete